MRFPAGRFLAAPGRRRKANPDGSMTLMEHLYELRYRLFVALAAVAVGGILGFTWWGTSPFGFITPGLYAKERKFAVVFVGASTVLFAAGAVLAYYVVPTGLSFLANLGAGQFITALTGKAYIGFLLTMLAVFGLTFELPLLVVMLNRVGVLPYEKLKRWQRGILFGLFVLAAVATPGSDPISMLVLAGALVVLFEASVLIARAHDRTLARRRAEQGWDDLDPDEPSPLDHRVEPVASEGTTSPRYDDAT
jgi:sec-independent protein translocase protein TatC